MQPHPAYLNPEIGYALWWLTHPERGGNTGPEILDRLVARGHVRDREEARAVLRTARANLRATEHLREASGAATIAASIGQRLPADTPVALRVRVNATDAAGNVVQSRSIVLQATAGENLTDVLHRARTAFNRRFRRGTSHVSGQLRLEADPTPFDVDQILIGYTEGV